MIAVRHTQTGCFAAGRHREPVERRVLLQDVHVDVLLDETVEQNGQRGEADVVQSQVGRVVQRLGRKGGRELLPSFITRRFVLCTFFVFCFFSGLRTDLL